MKRLRRRPKVKPEPASTRVEIEAVPLLGASVYLTGQPIKVKIEEPPYPHLRGSPLDVSRGPLRPTFQGMRTWRGFLAWFDLGEGRPMLSVRLRLWPFYLYVKVVRWDPEDNRNTIKRGIEIGKSILPAPRFFKDVKVDSVPQNAAMAPPRTARGHWFRTYGTLR